MSDVELWFKDGKVYRKSDVEVDETDPLKVIIDYPNGDYTVIPLSSLDFYEVST